MRMNELTVVIERAEHNYSAFILGVDGITTTGKTVDEIKSNIIEAIALYVETNKKYGFDIPQSLLEDYTLVFKMDVQSLLDFYSKIFTKAGLERITGINQKQLWHYSSGKTRPRPKQIVKIETALHKLGEELLAINI